MLTQEDLEVLTGLTQTKISRIESDAEFHKTRLWQLEEIASVLDVEIVELFDLTDMNKDKLIRTIEYLKEVLEAMKEGNNSITIL